MRPRPWLIDSQWSFFPAVRDALQALGERKQACLNNTFRIIKYAIKTQIMQIMVVVLDSDPGISPHVYLIFTCWPKICQKCKYFPCWSWYRHFPHLQWTTWSACGGTSWVIVVLSYRHGFLLQYPMIALTSLGTGWPWFWTMAAAKMLALNLSMFKA